MILPLEQVEAEGAAILVKVLENLELMAEEQEETLKHRPSIKGPTRPARAEVLGDVDGGPPGEGEARRVNLGGGGVDAGELVAVKEAGAGKARPGRLRTAECTRLR